MKLKEFEKKITSIFLGYNNNLDVVFFNEDGSFDFDISLDLVKVTFKDGTEKEIIRISGDGASIAMSNQRLLKVL